MRIVYHHRTRSTDAQRIHIQEIVRAFEELGHGVDVVSLVPLDTEQHDAQRDAGDAWWKKLVRRIPYAYEAAQLGYNLIGIPMVFWRALRSRADFIYERYALFNFAGVLAAKLLRIPLALEVNSPFALEQSRDREIRALRFAAWTERLICRLATRVIVVSTPLAKIMHASGVAPENIDVMSNGVALSRFRPGVKKQALAEELGLEDCVVIGFVGWFRKWHGLEMLLEAFRLSGLAEQRVKIALIGDGPAMEDLRRYAAEHRLERSVVFTGPLPHAAVPPYLDLIDIAVQPAANEYCCPMKILEYMALAKPVIAPAQENIQELLTDNEALFFTPGDAASLAAALRRMASDPVKARDMGRAARAAVLDRGYLWTENARRVVERFAAPGRTEPFPARHAKAS